MGYPGFAPVVASSDRFKSQKGSKGVPEEKSDREITLLTATLDHSWSRFSFRISSAVQILNFYLVAVAILSGAYVAALTQSLQFVASIIGIIGSIVSFVALFGGYGQNSSSPRCDSAIA
jgi:hypothetical protein